MRNRFVASMFASFAALAALAAAGHSYAQEYADAGPMMPIAPTGLPPAPDAGPVAPPQQPPPQPGLNVGWTGVNLTGGPGATLQQAVYNYNGTYSVQLGQGTPNATNTSPYWSLTSSNCSNGSCPAGTNFSGMQSCDNA